MEREAADPREDDIRKTWAWGTDCLFPTMEFYVGYGALKDWAEAEICLLS